MKKLTKAFDKCSLFLTRIATIVLFIVIVLVAVNIVGRKLFNVTISGIIEIVQYGMLTVMVLSMARTTFTGGHVSVSIITRKLPKLGRAIIGFLTLMLSAALVAAAAYISIRFIPKTIASGQVTERYKIPFYVIYGFMSFGLVTSCLTFILNAVRALLGLDEVKEELPKNIDEGGNA